MFNSPSNKIRQRINLVLAVFVLVGFPILIYRLYTLQIKDGEKYQKLALSQQMYSTSISAKRGAIYDANMKTLAQSATVFNVILSPADVKDEAELELVADTLATLVNADKEKILKNGKDKSSYYYRVKTKAGSEIKVEKELADKITTFTIDNKIKCINLEENTKRYYPYGSLASTVIGFTGMDNKGAYGLESYYDKYLSGTPGKIVSQKNAWGTDMPFRYQERYDAKDGNSIVLTIDEVIQHFLEKHLETAVVENAVRKRAAGIVMNVKTGEILAMATKPDFDPNEPFILGDPKAVLALEELKTAMDTNPTEENKKAYNNMLKQAQLDQWRNKAVVDPYEPGSVFKLITAAGAIESRSVKGADNFYCPGYHEVAGRKVGCWKNGGHGALTFMEGIKFSCNPVFMMVGEKMGPRNFFNYFESFGFTESTGIDFPGEADVAGLYHSEKRLSEGSGAYLASSSFGQTFKSTAIQLITAISATVNGGELMQPYLVKQIIDQDGNVIHTTQPQVKRQVISETVSKEIAAYAEAVVKDSNGSGRSAYIPGYRIGGKTGTSEKIDQAVNGVVEDIIASFMGFAPADNPQIAVLILLDEPQIGNTYGSVIAAPVVGGILADVLPYLGIEPQYTVEELETMDISTPHLIGKKPHDAASELTQKGLKSRIVGTGGEIIKQIPNSGQPIPRGGTVILYTEEITEQKKVIVPDILKMSGQQANRTILNLGLNIKITGVPIDSAGCIVAAQNPAAGTEVDVGTVVVVEFINKDLAG